MKQIKIRIFEVRSTNFELFRDEETKRIFEVRFTKFELCRDETNKK